MGSTLTPNFLSSTSLIFLNLTLNLWTGRIWLLTLIYANIYMKITPGGGEVLSPNFDVKIP